MDFVVGIVVGAILCYVFVERKKPSGRFIIDLTNPEKDVCTMEMYENLNSIYSKKQIVLTVKVLEDDTLN